jgi:hypothetical protein
MGRPFLSCACEIKSLDDPPPQFEIRSTSVIQKARAFTSGPMDLRYYAAV